MENLAIEITNKSLYDEKVLHVDFSGVETRGDNYWGRLEIVLKNGERIELEGDVNWDFREYGFVLSQEDEEVNHIFEYEDVNEVDSDQEAYNLIESHFGTLKVKSDDVSTSKGDLWTVYPPNGVYGECLYILIKK